MRQLPYYDKHFDFIFSFFTSFGYFSDDSENQKVINEIYRCLKEDGGVIMDFLNPHRVKATLVSEDQQDFGDMQQIIKVPLLTLGTWVLFYNLEFYLLDYYHLLLE